MTRIAREDLFHLVMNALQFSAKQDRRELERLEGLENADALHRVAVRVCNQIDNERRAVVQVALNPGNPFSRF